jgi:hypothetical protein
LAVRTSETQRTGLGGGAGPLIGQFAIMAGGFGLLILAALAAIYCKGLVYNLPYGEPTNGIHSSVAPADEPKGPR